MATKPLGFHTWPQDVIWDWKVTLATIVAPLLLTYLITTCNSMLLSRKVLSSRRPPTVPYVLPGLGHLISFGLRGKDLLLENAVKYGPSTLYKIVLPGLTQYMTTRPDNVARVFRAKGMIMTESQVVAMERSFGLSPQAVELYRADDSGYGPSPRPGSKVQPGDRIIYEIHNLLNKNLSGGSLIGITSRFQKFFAEELSELRQVGDDWADIPDLRAFMEVHVMRAAVKAMFGPYLLSLNPTLIDDFWAWSSDMGPLFMGLPKWLIPGSYRRREKMLQNIMRWHKYAHEHYDCSTVAEEDEEWEPYFGSKFSRKRQHMFAKWEVMDERSKAADDMSFIWASNANSVYGALWFLVELLNDPSLMARLHNEFSPAIIPPLAPCTVPTFDINKLCCGPVCQSVYAETLRLRVGVVLSRKAHEDLDFAGWNIKKGERVAFASTTEALNAEIWNAGTAADPHPLDTFWADRFLVYPDVPTSGPLRKQPSSHPRKTARKTENGENADSSGEPRFTMEGVANSWVPYSGGARHCPGRHFAKQEMISVAAIMTAAFEIELKTKPGWKPENDQSYFGFGTMPPKGKVPCRIRKRSQIA